MQVSHVQNNKFIQLSNKASFHKCKQNVTCNSSVLKTYDKGLPASVYKSNFLPSFGKYRKQKEVTIINRDTGRMERASLMKDKMGDTISYKLLVGKEDVGYLDLYTDAIFPEKDGVLTEPDNNIPEVRHLRSLRGDKYAGIGTALLDAAVQESKSLGKNGALWLQTMTGYAWSLSNYRKNENPIPFYYKLGFESINSKIDNLIKKAIKESKYGILPASTVLLLPSSKSKNVTRFYEDNYTQNYD